ncbi:MAG TPA: HIRAN domain-containing protein [Steroidobacteraceae bacterium]|nr:HIRAN domain-containing protein [Steroidobacteraceae bacterium]
MPQAKAASARASEQLALSSQNRVSPATELFCLCQTATADGALSARQLRAVRDWLDHSRAADVPARSFVEQIVHHILRCGRVSPADLQALGRALDPALPRELRQMPSALRLVGSEVFSPADETGTDRMRNEVLASACFVVVGCRAGRFERRARPGDPVLLVRDRGDAPSPHGIEVRAASGKPLGLVPELRARVLAPLLDRGARYRAHVVSAVRGTHAPVLIVQAFLYRSDALLGFGAHGERRMRPARTRRLAWRLVRVGVAALIAVAVAWVLRT